MKRIYLGCAFALILFFQFVSAETLQMPTQVESSGSTSHSIEIPPRGMEMDVVAEHFGEPQSKSEAVGKPPISVWQYSNYTVYFEYHHVIHTVVNKG